MQARTLRLLGICKRGVLRAICIWFPVHTDGRSSVTFVLRNTEGFQLHKELLSNYTIHINLSI